MVALYLFFYLTSRPRRSVNVYTVKAVKHFLQERKYEH